MRILFLTENFPPETNAAATRVYERACYWIKWGHEVTVLTCAPNFPEGHLFDGYKNHWHQVEFMDGLRVVRVKTYISPNEGVFRRTLDFLSFMPSAIFSGLFEVRPDVIISTSPQFFTAVAGWILGVIKRAPFIFELGDLWPASIVAVGALRRGSIIKLLEKVELFLYRQAAAVVALTHAFKVNLISRGISEGKIAVVINGVDLWRYGPREQDRDVAELIEGNRRFIIGYVGTHGMAHGLNNVLDAADILRDRSDIAFLLVGAGSERSKLLTEANKRGLDNVIFMSPQPKNMIPAVWSQCQVALVHLRNSAVFEDVIPSKIFEAMGMGLPIIVVIPEGEASTIVKSTNAGIHVFPEDPTALAQAVKTLADDQDKCRYLAEQSFLAARNYSREIQAAHMMAVFQAVRDGEGGSVSRIPRPEML